jgi:acetyltransferase-like isoleucine patch superfamily enzyme
MPMTPPATDPYVTSFTLASDTTMQGSVRIEPPFRTWPCILYNFTGGAFSYIAQSSRLHHVEIGRYCSIGGNVSILSAHPVDSLTSSPVLYQPLFAEPFKSVDSKTFQSLRKTVIGNDVWIGDDVKIKTGVRIGDGAVIGAGSVVTRDVAPYMVVGGVPARVIRPRFGEQLVSRLLESRWWRYNILALDLKGLTAEEAHAVIQASVADGILQPYEPGYYLISKTSSGEIIGRREHPLR